MTKKKLNTLPDFKHTPPPPPLPSGQTKEETIKQITALLANHKPAEQNAIVTQILRLCIKNRFDEYDAARKAEQEAGASFERLMAEAKDVDGVLKEIAEYKAKLNA